MLFFSIFSCNYQNVTKLVNLQFVSSLLNIVNLHDYFADRFYTHSIFLLNCNDFLRLL